MKIALIRQKFNAAGGAERFVSRAIEALSLHGAKITLLTRKWREDGRFVPIVLTPFYLGSTWRDWSFARAVQRTLRNETFDLVQSHERIPGVMVYRAGDGVHREWLKQRSRVSHPLRRFMTWLSPYHRYVCRAERQMLLHPNLQAVICISEMVKSELKCYFGLPDELLPVIYLGVDVSYFHPDGRAQWRYALRQQHGVGESERILLFVGSGFERKGLATVIQAMVSLPQHHLWIVGRDKHQARFASLARRLGVERRIRFMGTTEDVRPYYAAADFFTMPALYEPFGNVNMEAMACGLPVVTSFKAGAAELVMRHQCGIAIDALDHQTLVHWLQRQDSESVAAMGVAARKCAEAYEIHAMANEMTQLYQRLLSVKKP